MISVSNVKGVIMFVLTSLSLWPLLCFGSSPVEWTGIALSFSCVQRLTLSFLKAAAWILHVSHSWMLTLALHSKVEPRLSRRFLLVGCETHRSWQMCRLENTGWRDIASGGRWRHAPRMKLVVACGMTICVWASGCQPRACTYPGLACSACVG